MKFSLVVPFANSKDYLATCLDSLLAQSYLKKHAKEVEIILVNNNSADGTDKIAVRYARAHRGLIRVLSCKTWGAAAARNCGLRAAKGDFVWYIDSDDWIEPNALERLSANLEGCPSADVITFAAVKDYEKGQKEHGKSLLAAVGKGQKDWQNRFIMYGFGPWQFISRRSWLLKHELFFDEGIIHEDMALISSFVLYTKEIYALNEPLYHYVQHAKSVLHRSEWNEHALDIFPALEKIHARFAGPDQRYHDALEYFFIWNLMVDTARNFRPYKEGHANYRRIRSTMRAFFPRWRRNPYLRARSLRFRLRIRLNYWGL